MSRSLGRSREELLQQALGNLISNYEQGHRREKMRHARGLWSMRQLPNLAIRDDRVLDHEIPRKTQGKK